MHAVRALPSASRRTFASLVGAEHTPAVLRFEAPSPAPSTSALAPPPEPSPGPLTPAAHRQRLTRILERIDRRDTLTAPQTRFLALTGLSAPVADLSLLLSTPPAETAAATRFGLALAGALKAKQLRRLRRFLGRYAAGGAKAADIGAPLDKDTRERLLRAASGLGESDSTSAEALDRMLRTRLLGAAAAAGSAQKELPRLDAFRSARIIEAARKEKEKKAAKLAGKQAGVAAPVDATLSAAPTGKKKVREEERQERRRARIAAEEEQAAREAVGVERKDAGDFLAPEAPARRGRIKPRAAPVHIQWETQEEAPPYRALRLLSRTRVTLPQLEGEVLTDIQPVHEMRPVASLAHGLDRVLFNPGVHWLQDPRSRVFNFDPYLQRVPDVKDFAFERMPGFIKSSRDEDLWALCRAHGRRFAGSTSSTGGLLAHIYFLLGRDRPVDMSTLSSHVDDFPRTFTPGQRMPASVILRHRDGVYATDSDSLIPNASETNVLSWMGTMLEKFLTTNAADFSRYMRSSPDPAAPDTDPRREAYRYSMSSSMVLRSQLDAQDRRLPGRGTFDIKTRAALPVRLDMKNWVENSGYLINKAHGTENSFEREYLDLVRSAFLKYAFQARIGGMDGVIVAFHNTARVFGFQYVPLEEMEARLFGAPERGQRVFEKCVQVLEHVFETVTGAFPGKTLKIMAEKKDSDGFLRVFVEPAADADADAELSAVEQRARDEARQLGEGADPRALEEARVKHALKVADAEESSSGDVAVFEFFAGHLIDGRRVSAQVAMAEIHRKWDVIVTAERLKLSNDEARQLRTLTRRRQFRAHILPTGVSLDDMATRYKRETTINPASPAPLPAFDPAHWEKADRGIEALRKLARRGAARTRALDELDKMIGIERLTPGWVTASGVELPTAAPPQALDKKLTREAEVAEAAGAGASSDVVQAALQHLKDEADERAERAELAPESEAERELPRASAGPRVWAPQPQFGAGKKLTQASIEDALVPKTAPGSALDIMEMLNGLLMPEDGGRGDGGAPTKDGAAQEPVEDMHGIPLAPKGDTDVREWDERENLYRVDTEMQDGTQPADGTAAETREWGVEEEKALPGTKEAKREEAEKEKQE